MTVKLFEDICSYCKELFISENKTTVYCPKCLKLHLEVWTR